MKPHEGRATAPVVGRSTTGDLPADTGPKLLMRLVANKRSNQPSLRPCRAREDHLHEGVLQGQITRVTPAAIKLRMQRFSKGNFIGTSVQRCRTVLSCTKRATFLFPEPHSAVGSEFHVRRTGDRDSDDVAPGGQRFSGGDIRGTPLRQFTVGRIVYVTGYFPVSRATFGCWVRFLARSTRDRANTFVMA